MCKHELEYRETIEATTSIYIASHYELGEVLECNNEYGHSVREDVFCLECGRNWKVNKRSPKFILEFIKKINELRDSP